MTPGHMSLPRLACLDMAGTTVVDDGLVTGAFEQALAEIGHQVDESTREFLIATMGQSKIEVFTRLLGNAVQAERATAAFEVAYAHLVQGRGASLVPGTVQALGALRSLGLSICLTTGFAAPTRDLLIEACGLQPLIDLALSPADTPAGRGRPYPDMILCALMSTGTTSVAEVLVVGDTSSDMASGVAAGAGMVVGVLTGVHDAATLWSAGATTVIDSIADLPSALT